MLWLLQQHALTRELDLFPTITGTLDRGNVPWMAVRALSFTETIVAADADVHGKELADIPNLVIPSDQPIMVYGSYTLALIAKQRGWSPGAFVNNNYTHSSWVLGWGADTMLNGNARVGRLDALEELVSGMTGEIFVRPLEDTKSFSGMVLDLPDVLAWGVQTRNAKSHVLGDVTEIVVALFQEIQAEYRLFVVDGEVVSYSLYKLGTQVVYERYIPSHVLDWAKERIAQWVPDRAFVLDIAETPKGPRIIEVNNINSAGVYAADISKVIQCIECMSW